MWLKIVDKKIDFVVINLNVLLGSALFFFFEGE